jgi:hypothetical protein
MNGDVIKEGRNTVMNQTGQPVILTKKRQDNGASNQAELQVTRPIAKEIERRWMQRIRFEVR